MTFTPKHQRDADAVNARFEAADVIGLRAIATLEKRRGEKRSRLIDDLVDPDTVLGERLDSIREMFINRCDPAGTAGKRIGEVTDPFSSDADIDARVFVPLLKAAIWELYRDYHEWPDGHTLRERLVTWLNVTSANAERVVFAVAADPYLGQTFGYAHPNPNAGVVLPDEARWFISDVNEAYFQEELFQWRTLLGDDGVMFRVPFTLFASGTPEFWRIPA